MSDYSPFAPCPACQRHVREAACPFCGATTTRRSAIDLGVGRVSRAVVFASATLAASASCAHRQKASDEMGDTAHHGGGGCTPPDQHKIDELEAKKAELEKQPADDHKIQVQKQEVEEELRQARQPECMPYGAPPARRRVV